MKKCTSYSKNASWDLRRFRRENVAEEPKLIKSYQDKLSVSSCSSQTLDLIRSIVDDLHQINNEENLLKRDSKLKRAYFIVKQEMNKTDSTISRDIELIDTPIRDALHKQRSMEYQLVLTESTAGACCSVTGRPKIDCSVSTSDFPSHHCECATQTTDTAAFSEYSRLLMKLLTGNDDRSDIDLHRSRIHEALSIAWVSSK